MMRIYIGTCGLGLGHITRCEKIALELSNQGDDVLFSSYLDGLDYLKRAGLRHFSALPISFRTREDGTVDPKLTATQNGVTVGLWKFAKQLVGEVRQIGTYAPHVVISDTRVSTLLAGLIMRRPTCLILNQYSIQMPEYPTPRNVADRIMLFFGKLIWKYASLLLGFAWGMSHVIIVPDLPPPYTVSTYNLTIPNRIAGKVKLVGPVTTQSRERTPNGTGQLEEPHPTIFACVSGPTKDRRHLVRVLFQILKEFPKEWRLVLGCGDPNGSSSPTVLGNLTVYEWMGERLYEGIFEKARVVISRAGHETIMKAVVQGKPLIMIPPPNHTEQANNAKRAVELGVGKIIEQRNLTKEALLNVVQECVRKNGWKAGDLSRMVPGRGGARTIAETVYNLAGPGA